MGVYSGPDVSESGLVLYLDAGNNKSHSTNRFISYGTGLTTQGISFQVNGDGTFQRIAAGTVIGGYTVRTTDVVYSYALGSNGCHYHGNDVAVPGGSYATFSFDYLVTGATTYPIVNYLANFENYGGGALSGSIATANNLQNVWQRRTFTSGPTGSAGTQAMFLYPGGCGGRLADSGTIYFRNPKVEFTNVDTGNGNFSSMPNVTTWYDMSGNGNNGTLTNTPYYIMGSNSNNNYISFDGTDDHISVAYNAALKPTSAITMESFCYIQNNGESWASLIQYPQNSSSHTDPYFDWAIYLNMSSRVLHTRIDGEGVSSSSNVWNFNEWIYVAITFENQSVKYYVNGASVGSSSVTKTSIVYDANNPVFIGKNASGTEPFEGRIGIIKVYNRALSAAEIQQNFNATRSRFGI